MNNPTSEQKKVLENTKKRLIVSASAGSGKTFVLIEFLTQLICERKVPIKRLLVLTFTKAAAAEMKERLSKSLLSHEKTKFLIEQLDDLPTSDISTIDSFCEKVIKRYIDKTGLDESFVILDNEQSIILKKKAVNDTITKLNDTEQFKNCYFAFKRNNNLLESCLFNIDEYLNALEEGEEFVDYILNNQSYFYNHANEYLNAQLEKEIKLLKEKIKSFNSENYSCFLEKSYEILDFEFSNFFSENLKILTKLSIPALPIIKGVQRDAEETERIKLLKKQFQEMIDYYTKIDMSDENIFNNARAGKMATDLIKIYKYFAKEYKKNKEEKDALDFADIEKVCKKLLADEEVLNEVQKNYDYIFIDEYQDTNRLQESIIKSVAKNSNFIAVGDPKQGIYGFRNATMEIINEDITAFSNSSDGDALFLTGNFRSDRRILEFINHIFSKIMRKDNIGIDYLSTAMLEGLGEFHPTGLPAVRVDVIHEEGQEKDFEEKIYSVKEAPLTINETSSLEAEAILVRINEILGQSLYDGKLKKYRPVEYGDITILLRGRGRLMRQLSKKLSENGVPVICDIKEPYKENPQIQVLLSLIKLTVNKDDLSLLSVLSSFIGGFSDDELVELKENDNDNFYKILEKNKKNKKISAFFEMFDKFKFECGLLGYSKAIEKLLVEKEYYTYLACLEDGRRLTSTVKNFLNEIIKQNLEFSPASIIEYFDNAKNSTSDSMSSNAVNITTIHASKGLEFPIVILAGCGEKLEKPYKNNYVLNKTFGLATYEYNHVNNIKSPTPQFLAACNLNKTKEFIDEVMILYVALTRAKNHLYIVGKYSLDNLDEGDIFKKNSYMDIIFSTFTPFFIKKIFKEGKENYNEWEFNIINNAFSIQESNKKHKENATITENEIEEWFQYEYPYDNYTKIPLKSSVTSFLDEEELHFYSNTSRSDAIEIGNAYHEALKWLDFEKINDLNDLKAQLKEKYKYFSQGYVEKIDVDLLFKNILLVKSLTKGLKVYKERAFVMKEEDILIQGVVDLFALGKENILIDYKYSSLTDKNIILEKYKKQIDLYKKAIEKATKLKINKKYIILLKNAKLIEYFD